MIRASELDGRAVIDMDAAEKLGQIEKVILDPDARRVAALVVGRGGSVFGNGASSMIVPAAAVHAIGPDAVTVRQASTRGDLPPIDGLPSASDLIGRKVVSSEGQFLGTVDDVLINAENGRIVGYPLANGDARSKLGKMFGDRGQHGPTAVLNADAELRAGRDLIVAPQEAVDNWSDEQLSKAPPVAATDADRHRHATNWFQADAAEPEAGLEDPLR